VGYYLLSRVRGSLREEASSLPILDLDCSLSSFLLALPPELIFGLLFYPMVRQGPRSELGLGQRGRGSPNYGIVVAPRLSRHRSPKKPPPLRHRCPWSLPRRPCPLFPFDLLSASRRRWQTDLFPPTLGIAAQTQLQWAGYFAGRWSR